MHVPINYINKLIKIGNSPNNKPDIEKQIILTNTLALLYAFFIAIFTITFSYNNLNTLALISLLWFLSNISWLELNRRHKYFLASLGVVFCTDFFGFIVCWLLGKDTQLHYCYFAAIGVPLMLFGANKKLLILFTILPILCFFTLEWLPISLLNFNVISAPLQNVLHFVMAFTVFLSVFCTIYYYHQTNLKHEKKLHLAVAKAIIANKQLKNAQNTMIYSGKMVALGEMAGGIAHEINTPLSAISMNAQMLLRISKKFPETSADITKRADAIISISQRISKIISGLKMFATKSDNLPFEPFSLKHLISNTLDLCQEKFKNHGIIISVNNNYLELKAIGNAIQLSQTLLNLINNSYDSIQSLPEKWISIDIEKSDSWIEIKVTDSGHGISAEIINKIFDPFFTTKEIGKGTGLGLSISKGIMKQHKGDLLYDETCLHTRFIMKLPIN